MWGTAPWEPSSAASGPNPVAKKKPKKIAESLTTGDMPRQSPVTPGANGNKICSNNCSMGASWSEKKPQQSGGATGYFPLLPTLLS